MLESYLKMKRKDKDILLMTHIVLGYPSFDDCFSLVKTMVDAGVDVMELQIPFSEPIADGPVILHANHKALQAGVSVDACFKFAGMLTRTFDIPFLFMSYYNILFKYGMERFLSGMADHQIHGAIIPDLPPEEGEACLKGMTSMQMNPILIFSPTTSLQRMNYLSQFARGFIYCVARKGVTGQDTSFNHDLTAYLQQCRKATALPLAVGFGVKEKGDIDFLKNKADIAVIGTQTLNILETEDIDAVGRFIRHLQ
ncbi:MAG: tryptophan synthase subunit alpha [Deltaproteobacteria bacterium]|nr:tryptophan synthase subunit alpha [Deltaproteobacteria bacterium]